MMKALILMTRIPIPGKTKTRLMEILSGNECAELHTCFLMDLFKVFQYIEEDINVFLTYTPEDSFSVIEDMIPDHIHCFPQKGEHLGEKMYHAFEYVFKKGYEEVFLMGSDIPDIQPEEINYFFEKLSDEDVVLGPTFDGGYYFIGMKNNHEKLFNNKLKWGNKSVLEGTIDLANNLSLNVHLMNKHRDIDTKEDLIDFKNRIDSGYFEEKLLPMNTIGFINSLWSDDGYVKRQVKGSN